MIGYLSPDQVETMGFTQLVSGVGWLVKDGVAWVCTAFFVWVGLF